MILLKENLILQKQLILLNWKPKVSRKKGLENTIQLF